MRSIIRLIVIFSFVHLNIAAQVYGEKPINNDYYDEIIKDVNTENSLSVNLANLKKGYSRYVVINDTIYTSDDAVVRAIGYDPQPIYWSITRWVVEGDSIKYSGSIRVNYKGYWRGIHKIKFTIRDGYVYWRKMFTLRVHGKFPCSMFDDRVTKYIYMHDIISR